MLRECVEREPLAKILLDDQRFFQMFDFIVLESFDISSDAHRTFRVSAAFLINNNHHVIRPRLYSHIFTCTGVDALKYILTLIGPI